MFPGKDEFFDKYGDVMQNIEFAVMQVYASHPELLDFQVDKVLNGLIRGYTAQQRGRAEPKLKLNPLEQDLYNQVKTMCTWRLGQVTKEDAGIAHQIQSEKGDNPPPKTVDEIIACLKRIRRSVDFWTKDRGRRGYLDYVKNYFPTE